MITKVVGKNDVNVNSNEMRSMETSTKRVTMRDIADQAGVSAQTVSRVINNHEGVSDKVRKRIQRIIQDLDYQPNQAAQVLKSQRTHLLEVIFVDVGYMGEIGDLLAEISNCATGMGYDVLFSNIKESQLENTLKKSMGRMVEGVILLAPRLSLSEDELKSLSQSIPFVLMGNYIGATIPSVIYDFRQGTRLIIDHLVELGHEHVAEISGPLDQLNALTRHEEWEASLLRHGLVPGPSINTQYGMQYGYDAAVRLLERGEAFTAIFTGNDDLALGAIRALTEAGINIPGDVSIIGFDDAQHAQFLTPPLTTVRLDFRTLGKITAKYVVELIEDQDVAVYQRVLPMELIVRASTAPRST